MNLIFIEHYYRQGIEETMWILKLVCWVQGKEGTVAHCGLTVPESTARGRNKVEVPNKHQAALEPENVHTNGFALSDVVVTFSSLGHNT